MLDTKPRRPDSQQLVRQWALLRLLSDATEPYGVKQLADQLGASKATIERDLATLEHDFALVEESVGKQKKAYRIDHKIRALEAISFGTTELLAIYAAHAAIAGLSGTPMHDDLRSVISKIRGFLSPRHNGGLDAMARVFVPHARGHVDYDDRSRSLIDELVDAIARRHRVCKRDVLRGPARARRVPTSRDRCKLVVAREVRSICWPASASTGPRSHDARSAPDPRARSRTPRPSPRRAQTSTSTSRRRSESSSAMLKKTSRCCSTPRSRGRSRSGPFTRMSSKARLPDGRLRYRLRSSAQWEIVPWVQSFGPLAELVSPAGWRE